MDVSSRALGCAVNDLHLFAMVSRTDSPNDAVSKRVGLDFLNALAVGSMSEAKYVSSGADRHGLNEQRDEVWVQKGGADSLRGDDGAVDGGDDQLNLQRNGAGTFRFGHFGLAMEYYTHFTSPIRRYADVLVWKVDCEALRV